MRERKTISLLMVGAVLSLLPFFIGCEPEKKQPEARHRPNVVVLLVDTLRADHVGVYGKKKPSITPVIDLLAEGGVTFNKAYAPCSWTVPSIASLFTGMYPQTHGLTEGIVMNGKTSLQQRIPDNYVTLAQKFKEGGYATFCITTNSHLDRKYGYDRGFDQFVTFKFSDGQAIEEQVAAGAETLAQADKTTGYFLYLHWVDPHHPYDPREPYISQVRPDYMTEAGKILGENPDLLYAKGYFRDYPGSMDVLKDLYASEVAWTDGSIGRVLKTIPGIERALIVFLSDHGEAFGEHGSMIHGYDLYQETLHVPMVFHYPDKKGAGSRVDTPVSIVDVPGTLLAYAGIAAPEQFQGTDLSPLMTGGTIRERSIFSHIDKLQTIRWKAIFQGNLKLIVKYPADTEITDANKKNKTPIPERFLFDLAADPGETANLASRRTADVERMLAELDREMNKPAAGKPETVGQTLSEKDIEKLRTLNYLR